MTIKNKKEKKIKKRLTTVTLQCHCGAIITVDKKLLQSGNFDCTKCNY